MQDVFTALRHRIAEQRKTWGGKLTHGVGVADFSAYKEITGRIKQLDDLERTVEEEFTNYMRGKDGD